MDEIRRNMYVKGKSQQKSILLRRESFYTAIIKNAVHDVLESESADVMSSMAEFASSIDADLGLAQRYDFWTKFWRTIHEISLSDFDADSQSRISIMRKFATEKMNSARAVSNPRY